jgi:putative phosphoribosyl transferase
MSFQDRAEAGRRLAERLEEFRADEPVILGLPRGGVPVAAEVARALGAPLDVLVVRKLGVPWHAELGFGAIGEGGITLLNQELIDEIDITPEDVRTVVAAEQASLQRRVERYRAGGAPIDIEGRTVILVDDGIATGYTVRAAIEVARRRGAAKVVVAVPVAPPGMIEDLRQLADEVVVLEAHEPFIAVGQFYVEFLQTSDEDVARLLSSPPDPELAPSGEELVHACEIDLGTVRLAGELATPTDPIGVVLFAHGSGSSRLSPRNRAIARALNRRGFATLLFDLLTSEEERDRANVFDVGLLAGRLIGATQWLRKRSDVGRRPMAYFGASTGAAAALWAAADLPKEIAAVVSRGGRPDLASPRLAEVTAPTLLIVGGRDEQVLELNREAARQMRCVTRVAVVPFATHLFEEPGALARVAELAIDWFERFVRSDLEDAPRFHDTLRS